MRKLSANHLELVQGRGEFSGRDADEGSSCFNHPDRMITVAAGDNGCGVGFLQSR